jgi:hypothetical protein
MIAATLVGRAGGQTMGEALSMDAQLIGLLREWGVAGAVAIVAIVLFWFYRKDLQTVLKGAERREDRLVEVVERNSSAITTLSERLGNFLNMRNR